MDTVLLGTEDGLLVFEVEAAQARFKLHTMLGQHVRALAATQDAVLAAVSRYGVCRIDPGRWTPAWTLDAEVLSLEAHPRALQICLAGAEPAALHRSDDHGRTWRELRPLREAPGAASWYHPSPTALPRVLGIAMDPVDPGVFYAGIEVGGVLKTVDGGLSFRPAGEGLYPDVHRLVPHPQRPGEVWAVTGGGLYRTENGGEAWRLASKGMTRRYAAALGIVAGPSEVMVAAASQGPPWNAGAGASAVLFRSANRGAEWETAMHGLPPTLDGVPTGIATSAHPGRVYASVASGELLASENAGRNWRLLAGDLPAIQAVLCLPPRMASAERQGRVVSEAYGPLSAAGAHPL